MTPTVTAPARAPQRTIGDLPRPRVLKVLTEGEKRANHGLILRRAIQLAGLNVDEAAIALVVDRAHFSRWLSGVENCQAWRITECCDTNADAVKMRDAYIVALAERNTNARVRVLIDLDVSLPVKETA
jgi:hypothetical protein